MAALWMVRMTVIMAVRVGMSVGVPVVAVAVVVTAVRGMGVRVFVRVPVVMRVPVVALMRVGGSGVDTELDPFNLTALLAFKMHVEVSKI